MTDEHFVSDDDRPDLEIDLDKPIGEFTVRELQELMGAQAAAGIGGMGPVGLFPIKIIKDGKDAFDKGAVKDFKDVKDVVDVAKRWIDSSVAFGPPWTGGGATPPSPLGEVIEALTGLKEELQSIRERLDELESDEKDR